MRPSIGWVVTVPSAVRAFVSPYLVDLARDYDITLYVNATADEFVGLLPPNIEIFPIGLSRRISPLADLIALVSLTRAMGRRKHLIVHTLLPKSGLIGMTAAWLLGVPNRVHLFTGQVWANKVGWRRRILRQVDCWIANCANIVMADSPSQRDFLMDEQVASSVQVIGLGSVCGVDSQRFAPDPTARAEVRRALGIEEDSRVIGYLGRINRDKGVPQLIEAFNKSSLGSDVYLLIFGPDEEGLLTPPPKNPRVIVAGPTAAPASALAAMDLFCLPSFREGFGLSVLEASATGLPVVASRIYGLTDAVIEGETGWLVPSGDVDALAETLSLAMANNDEMSRRGRNGRARVIEFFEPSTFIDALRHIYAQRLATER